MSLLGAVYGTLLVNFGKTYFSETFPELWLFLMGGLFIAVVMYFPNGLAGLYESNGKKWFARFKRKPILASAGKDIPAKLSKTASQREIAVDGTNLEASQ
jgi:urea transport system permease protein